MKKLLILLLLACCPVWAQVKFEARVSKPSLGVNETLRVDFVMNADGDHFTPPTFEGFRVVGGPSQQVSQSWINGKSSFNKVYSYYLMPTERGPATIQSASVEIEGEIYKSDPIRVNVTAAVAQQQRGPGQPNAPDVDQSVHLVAEISKGNPYLNEPITVVYKLYLSYNIGVSNWRELNKPKYNDFWSQNIDIKQLVAEQGTYNGEPMRFVTLRKTVLYPQKSGKLTIEPLSLELDVQVPTGRRNFFGQQQIVEQTKQVSAGSRVINVKPLPEAGRPANFNGAVGKFSFEVKPSKTTLKNGESFDLTVSVSGTGNLKLFDLPKPVLASSLEVYDPVHSENVRTPLSGMTGKISDVYTIVPTYAGNYTIYPLEFSYFDLQTGTYKTLASPEIPIRVTDGPMPATVASNQTPGGAAQPHTTDAKFHFIKLKTMLKSMNRKDFYGSGLFYSLIVLPFLFIPVLVYGRSRKRALEKDIVGNRKRNQDRLARKYLSEAKRQLGNREAFYVSLERALHNFMKAKLGIETSDMRKDTIRELLSNRGATGETVNDFMKLIADCEFARYAPTAGTSLSVDYEKAAALLSDLEKQMN